MFYFRIAAERLTKINRLSFFAGNIIKDGHRKSNFEIRRKKAKTKSTFKISSQILVVEPFGGKLLNFPV